MGLKMALMSLIMALVAKGLIAEEHFNKRIVETFRQMAGDSEFHFAGVDQDGDGIADIFISVGYIDHPTPRRIAGLLREGATVSYDDTNAKISRSLGAPVIESKGLLEVNGQSMFLYFPNAHPAEFPMELVRQQRLNASR